MIGWERSAVRWLWLSLALVLLPTTAAAGRLDSVRSEVSGDSSDDSSDSSSSWSSDDDDDDYFFDSSSSGSSGSSGSSYRPELIATPMRYLSYPYQSGATGFMFEKPVQSESAQGESDSSESDPSESDSSKSVPSELGRRGAGQIWLEGAWQGRGLWRSGGGLRLDGQYFGIDGDLSYYLEPEANDALYLGTFNVDTIPVRGRRGLWRMGAGINTMIDGRLPGQGSREYALGWNITTSVDLFPAFPVVVSMRADLGKLHKAFVGRLRGSVGVMLGRMELYGGYEQTYVGRVSLGGPTVGLRLWL